MPGPVFITALITVPLLAGLVTGHGGIAAGALLLVIAANPIIWRIRKDRYFSSEEFRELRSEAALVVAEHNDVAAYVSEIRSQGTFELGASASGQHAHLAMSVNTSRWNYRRDRNVAEYAPNIHNASLQVVRNAARDPLRYLMKYFSIKADKETLAKVQRLADDVTRLQAAVDNIEQRERDIAAKINPPSFILERYAAEFWDQIGVHLPPVTVPYPRYKFRYVSAGGNSSQETSIELDARRLEALSELLASKIRWAKSAAGQRALMTAKLRTQIKERDRYACRYCGVSVADEPHLLLEVDHIVPVSRGGLSTPDNLQTLCWRCNRAKGSKMTGGPPHDGYPSATPA